VARERSLVSSKGGADVLFGQLRGNLVREKKGRVSAGRGGACVRQLGVAEDFLGLRLFFFKGGCIAGAWMGLGFCG
jgi:hypothetical protein